MLFLILKEFLRKYQNTIGQVAPVPNDPPAADKTLNPPGQTFVAVETIATEETDKSWTRIVILAQFVLLQVPSALTK